MYLFINEYEVEKYCGEVLKRYVGNRLVKTIANPKDADLKEFGYMEMTEEVPSYDAEKEYLKAHYAVEDGKIHCTFSVEQIMGGNEDETA